MKTLVLTDPREFLERAKPLLVDEARNNLVLGIARGMITTQARTKEAAFYVVERDGHPAAAAFITPPFNLFVSGVTDVEAIRDLARTVHGDRVTIPGVSGDRSSVDVFRDAWNDLRGGTAVLDMEMGVFSIEVVQEVPIAVGTYRQATMDDVDLVVGWMRDFAVAALPRGVEDTERIAALVRRRLEGRSGSGFWLWEVDEEPVTISGQSSPTDRGIRINGVYTPPAFRRTGYATSLVAMQSKWLLSNGYRFCCLYTDLANPTSNAIYRRIGYHQVGESAMYRFGSSHQPPATSPP